MLKKTYQLLGITMIIIALFAGCTSNNKHAYTVTYEADQADTLDEKQINNAKDIITERFKALDCKNVKVTSNDDKGLKVELSYDERIKTQAEVVGKRNLFKISGPDDSILITDNDIRDAASQQNPETKETNILIKFTEEGKIKFASATSTYIGKQIKICLDDKVIATPIVQTALTGGEVVITGNWSKEEANGLAKIIKLKTPLPFSFKVISIK
ncbi:MAG TPA: hypothetical protein VIK78_09395 [Ruminiclostridium sp.]